MAPVMLRVSKYGTAVQAFALQAGVLIAGLGYRANRHQQRCQKCRQQKNQISLAPGREHPCLTLAELQQQMNFIASTLPEYPVVLDMGGVGTTLGPQIMAEIGDQDFSRRSLK